MNASEGLLRIARLVRWTGIGFAALSLLMGGGAALSALLTDRGPIGDVAGAALVGAAFAAFFYGSARALAWVIEGFAAPK